MTSRQPVTPTQPFIVATNNYRASGGGHFPGLDGSSIVLAAPDGTAKSWPTGCKRRHTIDAQKLEPDSWRFAPLQTRGPVMFTAASGKQDVARAAGIDNIRQCRITATDRRLCHRFVAVMTSGSGFERPGRVDRVLLIHCSASDEVVGTTYAG